MQFSQKQSVVVIALSSIILFLIFFLFTEFFSKKPREFHPFRKIKSDMYLEDITYYLSQTNLKCKINAKNARWFQKKGLLTLTDINATIKKNSSIPIYIRALNGSFNIRQGVLTLKNRVRLKKGLTVISTSLLFFNSKKDLIFTNKPVKIVTQGLFLNGIGMTYNLKTGKLVVRNQRSIIKQH